MSCGLGVVQLLQAIAIPSLLSWGWGHIFVYPLKQDLEALAYKQKKKFTLSLPSDFWNVKNSELSFGFIWEKKLLIGGTATTFVWRQKRSFEVIILRFTTNVVLFGCKSSAATEKHPDIALFHCENTNILYIRGLFPSLLKDTTKKIYQIKVSVFSRFLLLSLRVRTGALKQDKLWENPALAHYAAIHSHKSTKVTLMPKVRYTDWLWSMWSSMWLMKINAKVI